MEKKGSALGTDHPRVKLLSSPGFALVRTKWNGVPTSWGKSGSRQCGSRERTSVERT